MKDGVVCALGLHGSYFGARRRCGFVERSKLGGGGMLK